MRPLNSALLTKVRPCPKRILLRDMANALRRQQPPRPPPSRRVPLDWIICAACRESSGTSTHYFFLRSPIYMSNANERFPMDHPMGRFLGSASYNLAPRRIALLTSGISTRAQPSLQLLAFAKEVQATVVLGNTNRSSSIHFVSLQSIPTPV